MEPDGIPVKVMNVSLQFVNKNALTRGQFFMSFILKNFHLRTLPLKKNTFFLIVQIKVLEYYYEK